MTAVRMLDQAGAPWLARMAPDEAPEPVVTDEVLRGLDCEIALADANLARWQPAREHAVLVRGFLAERVGRPWTAVRADIDAALRQTEADLEAAQASFCAASERVRDYEGYIRVLRERHPELADSELAPEEEPAVSATREAP